MGEDVGFVTVKVVDDVVVEGVRQILHRRGAVVPVAAYEDLRVGRKDPDAADAFAGDPVPDGAVLSFGDLVQKFEGQHVPVPAEPPGDPLPQGIEPFLVLLAFKEACLLFAGVEGEAGGLVQIQHHIEPVLSGP